MKGRIRPFEYLAWAFAHQGRATWDLSMSGVPDTRAEDEGDLFEGIDAATLARSAGRAGMMRAAESLCGRLADRYGLEPNRIALSSGASQAIVHVLMACVRAGDHVIIERPTYEALHRVPSILSAETARLERKPDDSWAIVTERLARLITPKTRAILLTNLHNPTGVAIPRDTLLAIGEMAARVGAVVLVDEVYLEFLATDDPNYAPAASLLSNGVSWSSLTKAHGFSALRLGWIACADPELARAIADAGAYLHVAIPGPAALLAERVLDHHAVLIERARARSLRGRAIVQDWLDHHEQRLSWVRPDGGLCGLLRLPELLGDVAFAEAARERFDTQVVPGTMFEAPGCVRIGFGGDPDQLTEGLRRLSNTLDSLL